MLQKPTSCLYCFRFGSRHVLTQIQDLLQPENANLPIREAPSGEVFVGNLSTHRVRSAADVMTLLEHGARSKIVAQTRLVREGGEAGKEGELWKLPKRDQSQWTRQCSAVQQTGSAHATPSGNSTWPGVRGYSRGQSKHGKKGER